MFKLNNCMKSFTHWYKLFTPILHRVKFTKCKIYGSTKQSLLIVVVCFSVCPNFLQIAVCKNLTYTEELKDNRFEKFCR